MPERLEIVLFGVGAIGGRLLRVLEADYPGLHVVGAVDTDPAKAGRRLGEVTPWQRFGSVAIAPDIDSCLAGLPRRPDIALHMTESKPERIEGQLAALLGHGMNVLSASEAMFHPQLRFPDFAARLDAQARATGVTLSGTGINPGFVYDLLPILMARATSGITEVRITRCIDVTGTGPGDIEHVGYGLTPEAFREQLAEGRIVGHMGAPESLALIGEALGLPLDTVTEAWETETAAFPVDSGDASLGVLPPGRVVGITQTASGLVGGRSVVSTRLAMYYTPERFGLVEADTLEIDGALPVRMTIRPALQSLFGAANVLAAAVAPVVAAPPGLQSMLDLPVAGGARGPRLEVDPARPLVPGQVPLRPVPG